MKTCKRYLISGQVQGVWYRASTQEQAIQLGLCGHARNMDDGRVEVIACGEVDKVQALETWLWQGPPLAHVDSIDITEISIRKQESFVTL